MAHYTITLKEIVNRGYNVFDNTWTTFDPNHKKELCDKIIRRYWFYEIGSETPDRFKHYLNEQLARIMPYYNELYKTNLLELQPLYNQYIETTTEAGRELTRALTKAGRRDLSELLDFSRSMQRLYDESVNGTTDGQTSNTRTWNEDGEDQHTINETGTEKEDTTKKEIMNDTTSSEKDEEMIDAVTGTKDTTGHSSGSTSSTRRYSDTPQGAVGPSGIDIDKMYLTNYTQDSGSSTEDTTGKETIKNDETKTTHATASETEDRTTDTTGTRNLDKTSDTVYNGTYSKDGGSKDSGTEHETRDTTTDAQTKEFENGKKDNKTSELTAGSEAENVGQKDTRKVFVKGFTVSQAQLLQQYRDTIINIDEMIVNALNTNFMGVY